MSERAALGPKATNEINPKPYSTAERLAIQRESLRMQIIQLNELRMNPESYRDLRDGYSLDEFDETLSQMTGAFDCLHGLIERLSNPDEDDD